jgi:uncharacterized protein
MLAPLPHIKEMIRQAIRIVVISLWIILAGATNGHAQNTFDRKSSIKETQKVVFPQLVGYVNDFGGILTEEQKRELTLIIEQQEKETTDQIAVVTLTSLEPYDNLDDYSLDLANFWGIGQKGKSNGILIAIATGLKKIRIQNGYGIETRLTDVETKRIIDEIMIPAFRRGNYYEGLVKALESIKKELE